MKRSVFLLLVTWSLHGTGAAQSVDRMTLKSFATATGHAIEIDLEHKEILWRFQNELEMRFPFNDVNFVLFGSARRVQVHVAGDTALITGIITEFSPDRGLQVKVEGAKKLTRIVEAYTRIILSEPLESGAPPRVHGQRE